MTCNILRSSPRKRGSRGRKRVHARLQRAMHSRISKAGSPLPRGRTEYVVGKTKPTRRAECGTDFWQNETNEPACATGTRAIVSLNDDPALDTGAQRADSFDVFDQFASDRRRI